MAEIFDSADNPLSGQRWWLKADDPWQCLAACFDLTAALRSPSPELHVSHVPIHMDGSCNGLQHYAAMGGDVAGARSVNLLPAERPNDVYSDVCAVVKARVHADALSGNPLAKQLDGKIERKIVKQTVMTSVYGVTFIGARQQIQNAMEDRGTCSEEDAYNASLYIARLTFDALSEMFLGARKIMDWLATCAQQIARSGQSVQWTTPLGLKISQPYRTPGKYAVTTLVQTVILADTNDSLPVSKSQQRSAFPPNYVHSLDSSHMMMTALGCKAANLTFAAVHDSYWTHADSVDKMSRLLRQAFIDLHSRPLLQELVSEFKTRHPSIVFPDVPQRGDLDLKLVLDSPYFFQ